MSYQGMRHESYDAEGNLVGVTDTRELAEEQRVAVASLKAMQGECLAATDWYFTRRAETGQEPPAEVLRKRAATRAACAALEAAILGAGSLQEFDRVNWHAHACRALREQA